MDTAVLLTLYLFFAVTFLIFWIPCDCWTIFAVDYYNSDNWTKIVNTLVLSPALCDYWNIILDTLVLSPELCVTFVLCVLLIRIVSMATQNPETFSLRMPDVHPGAQPDGVRIRRWEMDRPLLKEPALNGLYMGHRFDRPSDVSPRAVEYLSQIRRLRGVYFCLFCRVDDLVPNLRI